MIHPQWQEHAEVIGSWENRERAKETRRFGVGASDGPPLLGLRGSATETYTDKMLGPKPEPDEPDEKMETGLLMEPVIMERLRRRRKLVSIQRCGMILRSRRWPHLTASPDMVAVDTSLGGVAAEAKNSTLSDEWKHPTIPCKKHWVQCQHTMAVTGDAVMLLAGLLWGYQLVVYEVRRDDAWLDSAYLPFVLRFWENLRARILPEADDSEECRKALARLFPDPEPAKVVQIDDLDDSAYVFANEERARLEKACKKFKNEIRSRMGSATVAQFPCGTQWVKSKDKHGVWSLNRKPVKGAATEPQEGDAA